MAEPTSSRSADDDQPDDDQPVGDGWYDKKLDRKVRRLNEAVEGKYTVGDFISGLFDAIGQALSGM